jgi:hypothetical protein
VTKVSKISAASATLVPPQGNVLVFIDGGVSSPQFLAKGIITEATAFFLNSNQDGIKQITEILQNYSDVESIHLVSHGSPGSIQLGNTYLSLDTAFFVSLRKLYNLSKVIKRLGRSGRTIVKPNRPF